MTQNDLLIAGFIFIMVFIGLYCVVFIAKELVKLNITYKTELNKIKNKEEKEKELKPFEPFPNFNNYTITKKYNDEDTTGFESVLKEDYSNYFIRTIDLKYNINKDFNYFFDYSLIKEYHLNMNCLIMPNPLLFNPKFQKLNIHRFIHCPNVYQIFKSQNFSNISRDYIKYIIKFSSEYDIKIGCCIRKVNESKFKIINYNKPNPKTYYKKAMSTIFTEIKLFIIKCQKEYFEIIKENKNVT